MSFFLFIGGKGQSSGDSIGLGGYNGGRNSTHIWRYSGGIRQQGGDGATDIRTDVNDLESRIIVASGSGG